jgi:hypothetical protein
MFIFPCYSLSAKLSRRSLECILQTGTGLQLPVRAAVLFYRDIQKQKRVYPHIRKKTTNPKHPGGILETLPAILKQADLPAEKVLKLQDTEHFPKASGQG